MPGSVIVLGWSMAGRIAEPLHAALRRREKCIELFVSLAGATALPDILPALKGLRPSQSGLASIQGAYVDWLLLCLADQNRIAGRIVLDAQTFMTEMTGDFPIGLAASAMRFRNGVFVSDTAADAHDIGASQYGAFPPLALMTHASALDARHALTDRATWGVFITQQLCETRIFPHAHSLSALPADRWALLVQHVRDAAGRLSVTLLGNHMFFVGEDGARSTVLALKQLRQTAVEITRETARLIA